MNTSKIRWILILGNATLVTLIGLCLWPPPPHINIRHHELALPHSPSTLPRPRDIPAPDLERLLFRAASNKALVSEEKRTSSTPDIRFVGGVVSEDIHIAFVEQQDASLQRVSEGDEIDGWVVTDIQPRSITLTAQDQAVIYPLDPSSEEQ